MPCYQAWRAVRVLGCTIGVLLDIYRRLWGVLQECCRSATGVLLQAMLRLGECYLSVTVL